MPNFDPVPVGVRMSAGAYDNFYQGVIIVPGAALINDATGWLGVSSSQIAALGSATGVNVVQANAGSLAITNSTIVAAGNLYIKDAAAAVRLSATHSTLTPVYQSPGGCARLSVDGTVGPCAWRPTLAGASKAGSQAYAANYPVGSYSINGNTVSVWGHVLMAGFSGAAGNLVIGNLPVTPGNTVGAFDGGGCSIGRASGLTMPAGYTQLGLAVSAGVATLGVNAFGSGRTVAAINARTQVSPSTELQFICQYHR